MVEKTYISQESRERAEAALRFWRSDARKLYSEQRLRNKNDDIRVSLSEGLQKLKQHGLSVIETLTGPDPTAADEPQC